MYVRPDAEIGHGDVYRLLQRGWPVRRRKHTRSFFLLKIIIFTLIALIFFDGCSRIPRRRGGDSYPRSGKSYVINGKRYYILASSEGYSEIGQASWYGRDFHGKKTANGERYNMKAMTAAHKTLPLDTWVKVTNLTNNREIMVRINDRGPFAKGRIIDLSQAAADKLKMVNSGTAKVRVEALGQAANKKINGRMQGVLVQPRSYREGRFAVQVGSFQDKRNAKSLAGRLRRQYEVASIQTYDRGDKVFYRVQVADTRTLGQAMDLQTRLENQGYRDCFVVAR